MNLELAFSLREKEVVALVGGGGKTTLLFALGEELSRPGERVLLTTTTRIWAPPPSGSFSRVCSADLREIIKLVSEDRGRAPCVLIAREKERTGKLRGVSPDWVEELARLPGVSRVIVEADGAAGRPLKAPREGEPVFPRNTSLVIPVVGIDALGAPLDEDHVFRSPLAARLLGVEIGTEVTPAMAADLLAEAAGKRPSLSRVIPFINKLDIPGTLDRARELARILLSHESLRAEKIVLGHAALLPRVSGILPRTPVSP